MVRNILTNELCQEDNKNYKFYSEILCSRFVIFNFLLIDPFVSKVSPLLKLGLYSFQLNFNALFFEPKLNL